MKVSVMNKTHYVVEVEGYKFIPFKETFINVATSSVEFRRIRTDKRLRVGKVNNNHYIKKYFNKGYPINFVYDNMSQHAGRAYIHAIQALANPILKFFNKKEAGFVNMPAPGECLKAINCRFFSSMRIEQQGKAPVGPNDVFFSHGIGDKNYWIGKRIDKFKYACCPGPAWEKRMRDTGYKGEIFITGYTKLDPLINGEYTITKRDKPYIVWAPSHGYNNKNKGRSSYPFFKKYLSQISKNYEVGTGLHPTSRMNIGKKQNPTMQELIDADVVIADAGSTLYEAWILGKPVIFPDWICSKDVLDHFKKDPDNFEYQIYKKKIGYHARDIKHLNKLIDIALQDGMRDEEKDFIEQICPTKLRGKAGEKTAKVLKEIQKNI
jgi:hypothetical protein